MLDSNLGTRRALHRGRIFVDERDPSEVLNIQRGGMPFMPQGNKARNPAFDITPQYLITEPITEAGILEPPFDQSIAHAFHHEDEE